jgi:UDP-glucose 4-epimerase
VRALCLYTSTGSRGWLDEFPDEQLDEIDVHLGDIRDASFVERLLTGVDVVFHLAALIAIPYSYEAPRSFVDTNTVGTLNVLEAARRVDGLKVVHTSTSEVYGTPETVPISETHPLRGQSPYSASKIGADKLCEAYARSFEVPVTVLRPFNTYGPRQSARAVIPTILSQLLTGATEVHLGRLDPLRDFTYVTDTVDGFVRMATSDVAPGNTIQLGTGSMISIGDLFDLCCRVTGREARVLTADERVRPDNSEVERLQSDPRRAHDELGWRPTVSLADGLAEVAAWLEPRADASSATRYHR